MYNIIIADDEPSVRNGLSLFDWGRYNLTLSGVFEDGISAYERALEGDVDIIITDICMPVMDGFELVKKINERMPSIAIIVISAYDEFSYAQKLFGYNVRSYLLKPISFTEMDKALRETVEYINKLSDKENKIDFSTLKNDEAPEEDNNNLLIDADGREMADKKSYLVEYARKFIEENYQKQLNLKDIADSVYISPAYLSSLFSMYTSYSTMEYLLRIRVEKAKELLKNPKYRIKEISAMVGYNDSRYFGEVFKRITGMSPKEYRNNQSL